MAEWSEGLRGITGEQIKTGLDLWQEDWPPSLAEFRKACLGKFNKLNAHGLDFVPEYLRRKPEISKSRLLSSDERNKKREIAKSKIENVKAILNK